MIFNKGDWVWVAYSRYNVDDPLDEVYIKHHIILDKTNDLRYSNQAAHSSDIFSDSEILGFYNELPQR